MSIKNKNIELKEPNFYTDGHWFLVRCPRCGRENYGAAVASGICVWCGFDVQEWFEDQKKQEEIRKQLGFDHG